MTEDLVRFFNKETGKNWTPIFDRSLHPACCCRRSSLTFTEADNTVSYRWKADEKEFAMPIRVGQGRRLADDQSDDRMEEALHAVEEGRARGRD